MTLHKLLAGSKLVKLRGHPHRRLSESFNGKKLAVLGRAGLLYSEKSHCSLYQK